MELFDPSCLSTRGPESGTTRGWSVSQLECLVTHRIRDTLVTRQFHLYRCCILILATRFHRGDESRGGVVWVPVCSVCRRLVVVLRLGSSCVRITGFFYFLRKDFYVGEDGLQSSVNGSTYDSSQTRTIGRAGRRVCD